MKIIGGRDYYDGAGQGVDATTLFLRREEEIAPGAHTLSLPPRITPRGRASPDWAFHYFLVFVGGECLPGLREIETRWGTYGTETDQRHHFNLKDAARACADREVGWGSLFGPSRGDLEDHFRPGRWAGLTPWLVENRIITGVTVRESRDSTKTTAPIRTNGAFLHEFEVFKALDPATAHMRISNFISGVLPEAKDTVELSDIDRIQKAGFDRVSSFRTPKGSRKPRRRKG